MKRKSELQCPIPLDLLQGGKAVRGYGRFTKRHLAQAQLLPVQITCCGTGKLLINEPAPNKTLIVRSANRSPDYNCAVSGATRSKQMDRANFDIGMTNHDPAAFEAASRSKTGRGRTTVPIFLLVPQVKLSKRLDFDRDAERELNSVPGLIVAKWGEGRF